MTDLQINTRVTLPKGLPSHHEAWLEVRRSKYDQVFRDYIEKNCNEKGEQKPNLTKKEMLSLMSQKNG